MSVSELLLERFRTRPFLVPASIGVVLSAACIPLNSRVALVSCSIFCGICCFFFGFPAVIAPQSTVVFQGGMLLALYFVLNSPAPFMWFFRWRSRKTTWARASSELLAFVVFGNRIIHVCTHWVRSLWPIDMHFALWLASIFNWLRKWISQVQSYLLFWAPLVDVSSRGAYVTQSSRLQRCCQCVDIDYMRRFIQFLLLSQTLLGTSSPALGGSRSLGCSSVTVVASFFVWL
jgi:hypothetical protein